LCPRHDRVGQGAWSNARVQRAPSQSGAFDDLITEVRLELAQEALARAEQAAWEERQLTMVLDPVPVRVDARMRPLGPAD
jgi:hypothetical protein